MNNDEVQKALSRGNPSFDWIIITPSQEQYLVPFECERCGNCCRLVNEKPCKHFKEPNICLNYEKRPSECRSFPCFNTGSKSLYDKCPGYKTMKRVKNKLGQGSSYMSVDNRQPFIPTTKLDKSSEKLRRINMSEEYIERFIDLNS